MNKAVHVLWASLVREGDTVLDATAGNGRDTLYLAQLVGTTGHVVAIDVQAAAMASTSRRLEDAGVSERCTLHVGCHSGLGALAAAGSLRLVCFNLGWLPGVPEGKAVITTPSTTLAALHAAESCVLADGGCISVLAYVGHKGGLEEAEAVERWMAALDIRSWTATATRLLNRDAAPRMLTARRKGGPLVG